LDKQSKDKPFERFQRLIRGLAAVSKKEVETEEVKWKAAQQLKKKKRETA